MTKTTCKATRSDGKPCQASAVAGGEFCFWHDPARQAARMDAARRGGRSRAPDVPADDEEAIAARLADPVAWGEHYLTSRDGSKRSYWPHQVEDLRSSERNIIHLDGRDTGKSVSLCTDVLHFAFTTRGGQGLVAAPHQGHLDSLIEEIEFQIETHEELSASIASNAQGRPQIVRKPYFKVEFTNGAGIYFRPAGPYGEAFRSLHVERVWVDEGAWLSEKAWRALRQCLKAKGVLRIYSTPSGIRKSTYYRLTQSANWQVFRWPSWVNPAWDAQREAELEEFYGGRNTAGWQHEVAGEHGRPSFGAFNVDQFSRCRVEIPEYVNLVVTGEELAGCDTEEEVFDRLDMLLNLTPQTGTFWVGGDLGYTNDPTEIVVFRETHEDGRSVAQMVLRIQMEHVAYPHISEVLALVDRYYSPAGIGVDRGGNGLAVVQELTSLDKYRDLQLADRLHGYEFGAVTTIGFKNEQPLKKRTKEYMTTLINRGFQGRTLLLPVDDVEIEDQFTTQTYTLSDGKVVYSKGNDHIIDAVRCAALVRDQERLDQIHEETPMLTPLITAPIFW